jgi:hypothetical protein
MVNDNSRDNTPQDDLSSDSVGDVETAGETTAATTIGGSVNEQPVGADTLVKTREEPNAGENKSK